MKILELTGIVFGGALLAGLIGSLTGLGGGIIITPLLTLVLGVDIHYAIGAALVSVIATSCGAASAYVKEGLSNIRLGMFMEVATTTGALIGASLALRVSTAAIAEFSGLFSFIQRRLHFGRARNQRRPTAPILPRAALSWIPVIQLRTGSPVTTYTALSAGPA